MSVRQLLSGLLAAWLLLGCGGRKSSPDTLQDIVQERGERGPHHATLAVAPDFAYWNPQFYRLTEKSLSGPWDFTFDPDNTGLVRGLERSSGGPEYNLTITVPFPWQASLSGVGPEVPLEYAPFGSEKKLQNYAGTAWYSRTVDPPHDWPKDGEWVLRLGAADWSATVYIDGIEVGHHVGGYDPFEVIVPESSRKAPFFVAVRVVDPCAGDEIVGGKQGGLWYTCAGGIWQEVTLYRRPSAHIKRLVESLTGVGTLTVRVELFAESEGTVRATYGCPNSSCPPTTVERDVLATASSAVDLPLQLSGFPTWTPSHPTLLPRTIEFCSREECDTVLGYGARRVWSVDWAEGHSPVEQPDPTLQHKGFFVDGEPFYIRGILDQGYHPEGISQYPSRGSRIDELAALKALGFNTIRQHIKPEPPWFYTACDALGLAVIYDMPSPYDVAPGPPSAPWANAWEAMTEALVRRDVNHPSILFWVNFNEAWGLLTPPFWKDKEGLDYVASMAQWVRTLDPTRPVEDHSPGGFSEFLDNGALPHVDTDINSFHIYDRSVSAFATRIDAHLAGVFPGSKTHFFGPLAQTGQPLLVSEFGGLSAADTRGDSSYLLHGQLNVLRTRPAIQGFVYTQAYDVEWERNGLWTYAREEKETGLEALGISLIDLLGPNYLSLGHEPARLAALDQPIVVDVIGKIVELGPPDSLQWSLTSEDDQVVLDESMTFDGGQGDVAISLPVGTISVPGIYRLKATLSGAGIVLARNGAYLVVEPDQPPAWPLDEETLVGTRLESCSEGACRCAGNCELSFVLPDKLGALESLLLNLEISSYDPNERQTDSILNSATITLSVGEEVVCTFDIPDSPADHRGVLSHLKSPALGGAYGYLRSCAIASSLLTGGGQMVTLRSDHGLRVFTPAGGRFMSASTVSIP